MFSPFEERSPWLFTPVASSNPKLGTSVGALAGYLHFFDSKSRPSIFAVTGQYSDTESIVAGAFARTSFDEDHQRAARCACVWQHQERLRRLPRHRRPAAKQRRTTLIDRPLYLSRHGRLVPRRAGDLSELRHRRADARSTIKCSISWASSHTSPPAWVSSSRTIRATTRTCRRGAGYSTSTTSPFAKSLGGEHDYDLYRVEFRYFIPHGDRSVFALRQLNHLTGDAPAAARAPVQLRGYKIGQYTGQFMSSIEGEERFRLGDKWTATLFAGVACLYGDDASCSDNATSSRPGAWACSTSSSPRKASS